VEQKAPKNFYWAGITFFSAEANVCCRVDGGTRIIPVKKSWIERTIG
jgi:hypothetical protein